MSKLIYINTDNWDEEMYHQKCTCGHELYLHAFTMGKYDKDSVELRTSQCTFCGYDHENEKFICEGFIQSNE